MAVACALLLAVSLVAAGFAGAAAPPTTRLLAEATEDGVASPYGPEALAELACATRTYAIGPRGTDPQGQLAERILEEARSACAEGSPTAARWSAAARAIALEATASGQPAVEALADLAACGDQYALGPEELSHLDDCHRLIAAAAPWLATSAAGALAGLALLAWRRSRQALAAALVAAPCLVLAAFAGLGLWGTLDFNGLFAAFHGVLFPQGNWTFPARSLLISMYPLDFWVGMAKAWLGITAAAAILSLTLGIAIARKHKEETS